MKPWGRDARRLLAVAVLGALASLASGGVASGGVASGGVASGGVTSAEVKLAPGQIPVSAPVLAPDRTENEPASATPTPVAPKTPEGKAILRPQARIDTVPRARWAHRAEAPLWTRAAMSAMGDHGRPLTTMVPRDIANWCPAYETAGESERRAFWVGFMSALSKHESTYRPDAVGGGGLWYGLLQILPATARGYKCRARNGDALKHGPSNLSCAIRIMAVTVPRDGVIHGRDARWRGVSADWGPMRSRAKRADMAGWLKKQSYCLSKRSIRPRLRPAALADL